MDHLKFPNITFLCEGDVEVRQDLYTPDCPDCKGRGFVGSGGEAPQSQEDGDDCHACGGSGDDMARSKTIYCLGIHGDRSVGLFSIEYTPWLDSIELLEAYCATNVKALHKEIGE